MRLSKFQQLFLRQYRKLHESKSRKRDLLISVFISFIGSVVMAVLMGALLYFADAEAFRIYFPFGAGLVLDNSASQLGALARKRMAWDVVEEITDWAKVYGLLGDKEKA